MTLIPELEPSAFSGLAVESENVRVTPEFMGRVPVGV